MTKPQVGDIWCWAKQWHVLVIEELQNNRCLGMSLEDGEIDAWIFDEFHTNWEQKG